MITNICLYCFALPKPHSNHQQKPQTKKLKQYCTCFNCTIDNKTILISNNTIKRKTIEKIKITV